MTISDKPIAEDKDTYVELGLEEEYKFVDQVAPLFGLDAMMNPEKDDNKYAIDLVVDNRLTDLKKQETPFFTAEKRFGLDPQYTVTFNTNDYERYKDKTDGDLDIIFWVRWRKFEDYGAKVSPMAGLWRVPFSQIESWVEGDTVDSHNYIRRSKSDRNASASYGLSLKDMECIASIGPHNDYQTGAVDDVLFF